MWLCAHLRKVSNSFRTEQVMLQNFIASTCSRVSRPWLGACTKRFFKFCGLNRTMLTTSTIAGWYLFWYLFCINSSTIGFRNQWRHGNYRELNKSSVRVSQGCRNGARGRWYGVHLLYTETNGFCCYTFKVSTSCLLRVYFGGSRKQVRHQPYVRNRKFQPPHVLRATFNITYPVNLDDQF